MRISVSKLKTGILLLIVLLHSCSTYGFGGTIVLVQKSPSSFVAFKKGFFTKNVNFNAEMLGETGSFWMYLRIICTHLCYLSDNTCYQNSWLHAVWRHVHPRPRSARQKWTKIGRVSEVLNTAKGGRILLN